jgi:hypothetical protein
MCCDSHLDQQAALVASLALSTCLPKWVDSPRDEALVLRNVCGSRFTSHELPLTNHSFLIGCAAIRNRRNAMKTNGGLSF